MLWYPASKRNEQYEQNVEDFREIANQNFSDIASSSCRCEKSSKFPAMEQEFLRDQRNERTMIGAIDSAAIHVQKKKVTLTFCLLVVLLTQVHPP